MRNFLCAPTVGVIILGHAPHGAIGGPAVQRALQRLGPDGLGDIVVHTRELALLAVALYCRGRHRHDRDRAGDRFVRVVMPDQVRCAVPVDDGHLHIHEDDVGFGVWGIRVFGGYQMVQSFVTVPNCCDFVSQLADRSQRDLLVDSAMSLSVSMGLCVSLL